MARVVLQGVSKLYARGAAAAVEQLDLTVEDREFLVLVGPSGCGKTTTLRMIAGLEEPTRGSIRIGEREVTALAPKDRDIAMVFQSYALYPHMTVRRNMTFGLEIRAGGGWLSRSLRRIFAPGRHRQLEEQRRQIPAKVAAAAELLGIDHLLGRMPRALSGGERQRVALGRAIVRQPAAFLFDEPLSNLDARLRIDMRRELRQLHRKLEATIIYVTHDQVEALTLGDRVAVMHEGRLQQVGPPMEVYDHPRNRFVAEFLGSPAMNLVPGELRETEGGMEFEGGGLRLESPLWRGVGAREVDLGFRPEGVVLRGAGGKNRARIELIESHGDASVLHLTVLPTEGEGEGAKVLCKLPGRASSRVGETVGLEIEAGGCHLFDRASGDRLRAGEKTKT